MIIIAGAGFVGTAVYESFKNKLEVSFVDPKLGNKTVADFDGVTGVVICVNTPQNYVDNTCNYDNIVDVLKTIDSNIPVIVKSAVDIRAIEIISGVFPKHSITYSPEFLRQNTAVEDFANQSYVIMGGGNTDFWKSVWLSVFPNITIHVCSDKEASIIKYATNSFLAVKVSFFNQLHDFCYNVGVDFETVRQYLTLDSRINDDHSFVPGPDGKVGWGGHCFPKDTASFVEMGKLYKSRLTLIEKAREYNDYIRE